MEKESNYARHVINDIKTSKIITKVQDFVKLEGKRRPYSSNYTFWNQAFDAAYPAIIKNGEGKHGAINYNFSARSFRLCDVNLQEFYKKLGKWTIVRVGNDSARFLFLCEWGIFLIQKDGTLKPDTFTDRELVWFLVQGNKNTRFNQNIIHSLDVAKDNYFVYSRKKYMPDRIPEEARFLLEDNGGKMKGEKKKFMEFLRFTSDTLG